MTVIQGDSITYESRHAGYPTDGHAGIQGKLRNNFAFSLREVTSCSPALTMLKNNIAAGAMHNSKERHEEAPKCHPDTRKAVLGDITTWVSDHSKETLILWLRAPAGSGKSAILQQIAENFQKSGGLSASFFFSRFAGERNTDAHLIATLALQLATSIPTSRPFIEAAIERDPSIFERVISEQMNHLVVYPLIYASLHPGNGAPWPTLLLIDGLDECNGGKHQAEILRTLRTALLRFKTSLPTLYLLIASRPEPAIAAVFNQELSDITHHIVLDNSYNPNRDIEIFLRSSFADIYRRRRAFFPSTTSPWPPNDVINFLVGKSSGQFNFAATVIRFIDADRRKPTTQLELILDICESVNSRRFEGNPFVRLDEIYTHILNSSEKTEEVISILGVIFYLDRFRTPTPELIQGLLRLDPEDMAVMFWDLHSIIHIPTCQKDPIFFYHASFRDFLTDRHRSGTLFIDEFKARSFLLKLCIQTLSDFYGGSIQKRTAIALQYSRTAWQGHCELDGFDLDHSFLASALGQFNPETWLPLDGSAEATAFIMWWHDFAPFQENLHAQVSVSPISAQPSFTTLMPSSSVPVPIQGNVQLYVFDTLLSLIDTLFTSSENTNILPL